MSFDYYPFEVPWPQYWVITDLIEGLYTFVKSFRDQDWIPTFDLEMSLIAWTGHGLRGTLKSEVGDSEVDMTAPNLVA